MGGHTVNQSRANSSSPNQPQKPDTPAQTVLGYLHDVVYILAIALLVFTFAFRVVTVSGSSMFHTLADGDYLLLVNRPLCGKLEQGDIVVASMDRFKDGEAIVKRVIATEGQSVDIDFDTGIVYVDGQPLAEDYTYTPTNHDEGGTFPRVVEEGCVFLMGDNRNGSWDSRDPLIGCVDKREILGKAVALILPGTGEGAFTIDRDFSRIGGLN